VQYVDTSALLKRYVSEPDSEVAQQLLLTDPDWVTAAHTAIEVRRALTVRFGGSLEALRAARANFDQDWRMCAVVKLDDETCRLAAELAEATSARTLDALHLAAAQRAGAPALRVVTFDVRLARAARGLGWSVVGA
jgi:predicted nucleic acid-binding protein